jgi:iron complex outermembrane recepter protein
MNPIESLTLTARLRLPLAAAALAAAFAAPAARAQVAGDTTRADTLFYRLPEVTVTATRTPARILDVPLAVTVVGRREMEDAQGNRVDQALRTVPGVLAQSRSGGSDVRIVIRGFGARGAGDRSNAGTTRGIRILQDGVPETEPDGRTALDLVDLAAVEELEVVRSNASATWGNAAGGVVSFSTVPHFGGAFVRGEQQAGGFGLWRQVVRAGQPLGAGRLFATVARTEQEGWRANSESERTLVNAGFTAPLGARTELRLHGVAADNRFGIPGPLTLAALEADPRQANAVYAARRERRHNRVARLSAHAEHRAGGGATVQGMLYYQPKELVRSERGTYRNFDRYHLGGSLGARWERALSAAVSGAFSAGVDGAHQDGSGRFWSLDDEGNRGPELRNDQREGATNLGAYAQAQLSVGPRLELLLGGRWDAITYDNTDFLNPRLDDRKTFSRPSPKVGLLWRLTPERSVYASLGGGIEAPAGNETGSASTFGQDTISGINPLLEPIRSTTWEVGAKEIHARGRGLVRAFSYDAALYWTEVRNEIVPYRGGRFYFSAGAVRRRGAELGARLVTAPGIEMEAALTGSDHRYTSYMVDSVHYGRPGAFADFGGNRVVGVPDFHGSGVLRWTPRFLDEVELDLGVQRVDGYWADDANQVRVPGYTLWNAGVALRRPVRLGGGVTARGSARVENLADARYVASAFLNPDVVGGEPVAFEPGLPRHLVLGVTLGWGR